MGTNPKHMYPSHPSHPSRLVGVVVVAACWASLVAPICRAQEGEATAAAWSDDQSVDALLNRLRIPAIRNLPDKLRDTIARLLASGSPLARARLRTFLEDPSAPREIAEQTVRSVLADDGAVDLVDAVVERLRIEGGSSLAKGCDELLAKQRAGPHPSALGKLALDRDRPVAFRMTAARALGKTGREEGLETLLALWDDDTVDAALREVAQTAYRRILPATPSVETARADVGALRSGATLTDLLRERVAAVPADPDATESRASFRAAYGVLAGAAMNTLPIEQVIDLLVLESPSSEIRVAAVRRVASHDFAADAEPERARRGAGEALLLALRTGQEGEVLRVLVVEALPVFAEVLREHAADGARARLEELASVSDVELRDMREGAVRLIGALRLRASARFLQAQFDGLGDTDAELRLAVLDALDQLSLPADEIVPWLADRVRTERTVRIAEEMVATLSRPPVAVSVDVFVALLETRRAEGEAGVRNAAVAALGVIWSNHDAAACTALVERGLRDPVARVRETSAGWLESGPKERLDEIVPALERVIHDPGEELRVRTAATRAVLELTGDEALAHLGAAIEVDEIFDAFIKHRLLELDRDLKVASVLADARALWAHEGGGRRDRAVTLLQRVVAARETPWEAAAGRGLAREQLARWLLERGNAEEALRLADDLLKSAREDDPKARWEVLAARAARTTGTEANLVRAARTLDRLAAPGAAAPDLLPRILLELGDALLALGDPAAAAAALGRVVIDGAGLDEVDAARLRDLRAVAAERSEAERLRFDDLVNALGGTSDTAAREAIARLGYRAARRVNDGLAAAADDAARERLLRAAAAVAGRTFERGEGPEGLLGACNAARERMAELVSSNRFTPQH